MCIRDRANTYADAILRLSYTYLKNTHDAQDICQTVFVKLLMEPREFKSPEHERAYICLLYTSPVSPDFSGWNWVP